VLQVLCAHQVDLVEQDRVGERDLVDNLVQGVRRPLVQELECVWKGGSEEGGMGE
jgi:hypothetical protein